MNIKKLIPKNIRNLYINIEYKKFTSKNKLNILNDEETIKNAFSEKRRCAVPVGISTGSKVDQGPSAAAGSCLDPLGG